jgi:double stranded RNA-specific editase B
LIKIPIEEINEEEEKSFYAIGNSKKQAKQRVTKLALESLFNIKVNTVTNNNNNIVDDAKFRSFANNVTDLIKEKYIEQMKKNNILESNDSKLRTVYASIVQTNDVDLNKSKIICITSGTKCINGEYMSLNGSTINDSHAEVLACRLLKKYLYETLELYIDYLTKKQTIDDINENYIWELINNNDDYDDDDEEEEEEDEEEEENNKTNSKKCFRLKKNVKFHLFISTTPCGDGRIFAVHDNHDGIDNHPNRKIRGLLRAKLESGEGTIPCGNFKLQTWDAILHGDRLKVMSCSDKLCKLNVVGGKKT